MLMGAYVGGYYVCLDWNDGKMHGSRKELTYKDSSLEYTLIGYDVPFGRTLFLPLHTLDKKIFRSTKLRGNDE